MRLGELLTETGAVTADQIEHAIAAQHGSPDRLGTILIRQGVVDPDVVAAALAKQKGVAAARRAHFEAIDRTAVAKIDGSLARQLGAIPIGISTKGGQILVVAMADPDDIGSVDELAFASGMRVRPVAAPMFFISQCLDQLYAVAAAPAPAEPDEPLQPEPQASPDAAVVPADPFGPPAPILQPIPLAARAPAASARPSVTPAHESGQAQGPSPFAPAAPSTAFQGTSESVYTIAGIAIAALGILAFVIAIKSKNAGPSETSVTGVHYISHVGVEVEFPEDGEWKYLHTLNDSQDQGLVTIKGSYFYRGGSSNDPHLALVLGAMDMNGRMPNPIPDRVFRGMLDGARKNLRSFGAKGLSMRLRSCDVIQLRSPQTGRCTGSATYKGKRRELVMYLWAERQLLLLAAVLSRGALEDVRDEYEAIVGSVAIPIVPDDEDQEE